MARELFSTSVVTGTSVARRSRLLPISIALHGLLLGAVLVLPLVADSALPDPRLVLNYGPMPVVVPPPPPAPPATGTARAATHAANPALAPLTAPERLPSHDTSLEPTGDVDGVVGGVPDGIPGGLVEVVSLAPPPPPPARAPVHVGGVIQPPTKIRDVVPLYPVIAQTAHVEGIVILEAVIDEVGAVSGTRVLRSIPLLDLAAVDAVRQWRFTPTRLNGQPVAVVMTVTVEFRLQR